MSGGVGFWEVGVSNGSRIVVAEAFLHPSGINYRVATGPGWAAVGGTGQRWGRWFATDAWEDSMEGTLAEATRALVHIEGRVHALAEFLDHQRPLPLGSVPDVVRGAPSGRPGVPA